jgi:hypothetical protein
MLRVSSSPEQTDDGPLRSVRLGNELRLFLASLVALYFELLIIRHLSTESRIFANLKNLPLVASFSASV